MGSILGNRVARVEDPRFLTTGGHYVDDIRLDGVDVADIATRVRAVAVRPCHDLVDRARRRARRARRAADLHRRRPRGPRRRVPGVPGPVCPSRWGRSSWRPIVSATSARPCARRRRDRSRSGRTPSTSSSSTTSRCRVVVDVEESARDETLLYPEAGSNAVLALASPQRADFDDCEVVVEERIVNQRLSGAPMEARVGAARWTDDGRLEHYSACQGAHPTKTMLCSIYGLEPDQVRVVVPDMGGGFGVKSRTYPDEAALGFYAKELGRPVRWTETRSENFLSMPQGRGQVQYAKHRRHARRPHHRLPARRLPGRRRLPDDGLGAPRHDDAHALRLLRHHQRRLHRHLMGDEHAVDHRVPRRRPARGRGGDRADGRPFRCRDRHGPRRGAAGQPAAGVPGGDHHRDRHALRRRRLPPLARPGARRSRLRRPPCRTGRAARASDDPVQLGIGIATYVEITSGDRRVPSTERSNSSPMAGWSCGPERPHMVRGT